MTPKSKLKAGKFQNKENCNSENEANDGSQMYMTATVVLIYISNMSDGIMVSLVVLPVDSHPLMLVGCCEY